MSEQSNEIQSIIAKLEAFLSERRKSEGGGYAKVTDEDVVVLGHLIRIIIKAKYERDADGDLPLEFEIVNRRTHERMHFMPVPYSHSYTDRDVEKALDIALMNLSIATRRVDNLWQHRRAIKQKEADAREKRL